MATSTISGFLVIDKPKGITSAEVVRRLKKVLKVRKIGHTGTLDPLATGILIVAVGKATRFSEYLLKKDKCYVVKGTFGLKSDTYDIDGKVEKVECKEVDKDSLLKTLENFKGEIEQVPPPFSAIRVNGKRAYDLARKGEKVELKPRKVRIYSLELLDFNYPEFTLKVCCSSGTYIRSLINDIGKSLSCSAIVSELRRVKVGKVDEKVAIPLSKITKENVKEFLIPIEELLNFPKIVLSFDEGKRFKNGVKLKVREKEGTYKVYVLDTFIGIGIVKSNLLKPQKVFPSSF